METLVPGPPPKTIDDFPQTRFMGSKRKLLGFIADTIRQIPCKSVLDAFSGSGCVSYLFKTLGKQVSSNDYLSYCYHIAAAAVENSSIRLDEAEVDLLCSANPERKDFIQKNFNGLYFTPEENAFFDNVSANIRSIRDDEKKRLAVASLCRAALKKQPRGLFTVTGSRYDDGRKDLRISVQEQFFAAAREFNQAVFDNGEQNRAYCLDIFDLPDQSFDLVYLDPPYVSLRADNDYMRRYHFLEGLSTYWEGVKILEYTKTKKIAKRPTPFASRKTCRGAFERLFQKFPDSKLLVSYSSNCMPSKEEMIVMLKKYRRRVEVFESEHRYCFANQRRSMSRNRNQVTEFLFLAE